MSERESERKEAWSGLQGGCAPIGRGSRDAGIDSRDKGDLSFHSLSGGFGGMQMTKVEFGRGKRLKQRSGMAVSVGGGDKQDRGMPRSEGPPPGSNVP